MIIKQLRERRGLTPTQLADAMGVSLPAVRKWELGAADPSADKLPTLADVLGVSIDALYGREPPGGREFAAERPEFDAIMQDLREIVKSGLELEVYCASNSRGEA